MADRSYVEENQASLERLRALVERMTDDDLATAMDAGWTVASVLGHMAFWDLRIVTCLERWGATGGGVVPTYHDDADDWINDSVKPIVLALEPRVAARISLEAAEAADAAVAAMSDDLLERNEALGLVINPSRTEHRVEHLDEIEARLAR